MKPLGFALFEVLVVMVLIGIVAVCIVDGYLERHRPTMELKKDEWECVKSEPRTYLQPMLVWNITILQPITSTVCVEFIRLA